MVARRCTWFLTLALACAILLAGAAHVRAQGQAPGTPTPILQPPAGPWVEADFRVGGLWPQEALESLPTLGGRFAIYPWPDTAAARVSVQGVVDYRQLGRVEDFDVTLGSRTVRTDHLVLAGPAVGLDLLRTPRFAAEMRFGGALVGHRTTFALESDDRFVDDFDEFENVCRFTAFRDRCQSDYTFTGTVAAGMKGYFREDGGIFVGIDYTYLTRGQNILAGAVGYRFR